MTAAPFPELKRCTGPTHPKPVYLPVTTEHWYFHKGEWARSTGMVGKPLSRCRLCWQWVKLRDQQGPHGLVPSTEIFQWLDELIQRCDSVYAVQRHHGISHSTISRILSGKTVLVRRATAQRILTALAEQRQRDRRNGSISESFHASLREKVRRDGHMTMNLWRSLAYREIECPSP